MALATFVILVLALKRLYQGWTSLCIADTLVTKLKKERKDYIYRYIYIYIYIHMCVCVCQDLVIYVYSYCLIFILGARRCGSFSKLVIVNLHSDINYH
jgi:hypothetical protein